MSDALAPDGPRRAVDSSASPRHRGAASKATGRLTINAAFLQEIKDDNRQLKSLWDRLLPMLSHPETARNHWSELVAGLSELRDQLAIHFSLEEAFGYFDDAVDAAPHLSLKAETLKSQHSALFARARDLADQVADFSVDRPEHVEKLLRRFDTFRVEFERHEEAELKMILQCFEDDLGVGD